MQVVSVVVIDINVIGFVPVLFPVFRIWIQQQERIAAVRKLWVSHVHRRAGHPEPVPVSEIETEAVLGNVVAPIASPLVPGAIFTIPLLGAALPP